VQQASFVDDLFRLFCKGDRKALEIATASSDYFFLNGGKDIVFLLMAMMNFCNIYRKMV